MKIVITGGPCCGKTSVINALKEKGYSVIDEVAREIIRNNGFNRKLTPLEAIYLQTEIYYKHMLLEKEIDSTEMNSTEKQIFLDRGYVDHHAYCQHLLGYVPKELIDGPAKKYDAVLIFERLPLINDGIRRETEHEAEQLHNSILQAYYDAGYEPILIPATSIEDRVKKVLEIADRLKQN